MVDSPENEIFKTGGGLNLYLNKTKPAGESMIGRQLGKYKITRLIAEGGMSFVYAATRSDDQFDRDVAIKVSPGSLMDSRLRELFLIEQGVLASLNHPGISQLYDAAVTEEGWPYIVMELIDGESITDHVKRRELSLRQRLHLMLEVVEAISYAHARLIVHRDLKPSNVMVTADGKAKILDFGIAKLLDNERTKLTHAQALTPRYASPEQLLGKTITVGSDIYQLGALLLEVLTGQAPNDDSLTNAIERSASGKSLKLNTEIRRSLPREIVLIIEECLRNNPEERYRDINALRDDFIAYIEGYPVKAAGQSKQYRFRKFIGRNLAASVIAASAFITIAASTVWYTLQLTEQTNEAQRQTELAEESLDFLAGMFKASDPDVTQGANLSAVDLLQLGTDRIRTEMVDKPETQTKLYLTIGQTLYRLGELDKAEKLTNELVSISQQLDNRYSLEKIKARSLLGNIKSDQGDIETALTMFEQLERDAERSLGPTHPETLNVKNNLGNNYWDSGNLEDASELYQEVYDLKVEQYGPAAETSLTTAVNLANLYRSVGTHDNGAAFTRKNLALAEESLGPLHTMTVSFLNLLAMSTYVNEGVHASIPFFEEVLLRRERIYGNDGFHTGRSRARLGTFLAETGEIERGKELQEAGIKTMIASRGGDHPRVLSAKTNYASTLASEGRHNEVLKMLPTIIEEQTRIGGKQHPDTLYSRVILAKTMIELNDPESQSYRVRLKEDISKTYSTDHWLHKTLEQNANND